MTTVKQPFRISATRATYLFPCPVQLEQESRGLYGFHNWSSCPNCRKEFKGWELWGENGHLQGLVKDIEPETIRQAEQCRSTHSPVVIDVNQSSGFTYRGH